MGSFRIQTAFVEENRITGSTRLGGGEGPGLVILSSIVRIKKHGQNETQ